MAGGSLLLLLDDIASVLDDVALMTKVAAKKTSGVLGDDLALNAQQVSGVRADRELPVVWAVAKGSMLNKAILVPTALAISAWAPSAIAWLLIAGGLFLCFEGVEKLVHKALHPPAPDSGAHHAATPLAQTAPLNQPTEASKIKGAIRTDFVLSAEIIVITLGVVADRALNVQIGALIGVAILMTIGVYGLVAGIVKLDDLGFWLIARSSAAAQSVGRGLIWFAPWLMKGLAVVGTAAMFLVGGGILVHNIAPLHHWLESVGALHSMWISTGADLLVGVIAGALALAVLTLLKRVFGRGAGAH
jgi:uncharacterized protein